MPLSLSLSSCSLISLVITSLTSDLLGSVFNFQIFGDFAYNFLLGVFNDIVVQRIYCLISFLLKLLRLVLWLSMWFSLVSVAGLVEGSVYSAGGGVATVSSGSDHLYPRFLLGALLRLGRPRPLPHAPPISPGDRSSVRFLGLAASLFNAHL